MSVQRYGGNDRQQLRDLPLLERHANPNVVPRLAVLEDTRREFSKLRNTPGSRSAARAELAQSSNQRNWPN
jgi:hypothetical protein